MTIDLVSEILPNATLEEQFECVRVRRVRFGELDERTLLALEAYLGAHSRSKSDGFWRFLAGKSER